MQATGPLVWESAGPRGLAKTSLREGAGGACYSLPLLRVKLQPFFFCAAGPGPVLFVVPRRGCGTSRSASPRLLLIPLRNNILRRGPGPGAFAGLRRKPGPVVFPGLRCGCGQAGIATLRRFGGLPHGSRICRYYKKKNRVTSYASGGNTFLIKKTPHKIQLKFAFKKLVQLHLIFFKILPLIRADV